MQTILALAVVVSLVSPVFSQEPLILTAPQMVSKQRATGVRMRAAGIVLTTAGLGATLAGALVMIAAAQPQPCQYQTREYCGFGAAIAMIGGVSSMGFGGLLTLIGAPLWGAGQHRIKRADLSLAPVLGQNGIDGATASFRMAF
jgi:hypothetical protein